MKMRIWFAALMLAPVFASAQEGSNRFQIFQGNVVLESAKIAAPTPVILKIDAQTGETWRLMPGNTYWWIKIDIDHGVIPKKEEKPQ
jgi:hypothetical protein